MTERGVRPLPIEIAGIDPAWLSAALSVKYPGAQVERGEVVDIINGTCTKVRLRLHMNEAGRAAGIPSLVILKGGFEPHSRSLSETLHLAEVRGYRDIFPVLPLLTPVCYFADYDEDQRQGIVIMEDLRDRGVEFCSALKPQGFEEIASRLRSLAEFHALTWNSADVAPNGRWDFLPDGQVNLHAYMDLYLEKREEWERFVGSARGAASSVKFHDLDLIVASFANLVKFSQRLPRCLVRGDCHLGNLYVDVDGSPGFFDALPSLAPGMMEISYHLGCALDTFDRRRWEGALIQIYLDELRARGVEPPSLDEALVQYAAFLLNGFIIFMVNEAHYQSEAVNTAYTARFSAAMIDHDTIGTLSRVG